jgi:hypothetical protein
MLKKKNLKRRIKLTPGVSKEHGSNLKVASRQEKGLKDKTHVGSKGTTAFQERSRSHTGIRNESEANGTKVKQVLAREPK